MFVLTSQIEAVNLTGETTKRGVDFVLRVLQIVVRKRRVDEPADFPFVATVLLPVLLPGKKCYESYTKIVFQRF